jgi:putative IMPACT (imprinted ancient) family translation regulator
LFGTFPVYRTTTFAGGIKLGAGGLIRAYGGAARQVLREAPVDVLIPKSTFRVSADGSHVGSIYDSVNKVGGSTSGEEYGADGSLAVTITCDLEVADRLRAGLRDATRGDATFPEDDQKEDSA